VHIGHSSCEARAASGGCGGRIPDLARGCIGCPDKRAQSRSPFRPASEVPAALDRLARTGVSRQPSPRTAAAPARRNRRPRVAIRRRSSSLSVMQPASSRRWRSAASWIVTTGHAIRRFVVDIDDQHPAPRDRGRTGSRPIAPRAARPGAGKRESGRSDAFTLSRVFLGRLRVRTNVSRFSTAVGGDHDRRHGLEVLDGVCRDRLALLLVPGLCALECAWGVCREVLSRHEDLDLPPRGLWKAGIGRSCRGSYAFARPDGGV
jgi:hypothetical protein